MIRQTFQWHQDENEPTPTQIQKEPVLIFFRFPYYGDKGFQLIESCICKIKLNCKNDRSVPFLRSSTIFVKWTSFITPKTELINQSFVVYEFTCPGCNSNFAWKIETTLYERSVERTWKYENGTVKNHIDQCEGVHCLLNLATLGPTLFSENDNIGPIWDNKSSRISFVFDNIKIIDGSRNFLILEPKGVLC